MDKSIMAMADDILGGALSNPSKAQSQLSNPYNEPELPEVSDAQRESMIMESVNEKLGSELKKFAKKTSRDNYPGDKGVETRVDPAASKANLSPKAKAKLSSHRARKASRDDKATSWAVDRTQQHQKDRWAREGERQKRHDAARGVKTRGAQTDSASKSPEQQRMGKMRRKDALSSSSQDRMALLKKKREAEEKRRRSQGVQARKPAMENSNLQILLQARDILREMTGVGAIGVGPQVTGSRGYSTHGADMGKDTVKVEPVDKALRKTEKGKAKKKKVKKESFDLFLDRIINETQETK